jgi:hypothetical protein
MRLQSSTPTAALLDVSLILGPLCYLFLDTTYAVRGWWDAPTGAFHVVVAGVYALTAIRLVTLARGWLQAVMLLVAMFGVVGNAGVGFDTIQVGLGGIDLFKQEGAANVLKALGFFFPLTLLLAAAALRNRVPTWQPILLGIGALLFPVAHVADISWLAILDAVIVVFALGYLFAIREDLADLELRGDRLPVTSRI